MLYAQIKNNIVKNTIIIEDPSLESIFSEGFDSLIRIDNLDILPGKDWTYDGENFVAPNFNSIPQQAVEVKIQHAIEGFNKLSVTYAAQNVLLGITQYGKTKLIADTLADVMRYGQSGSLYQVIASLQAIQITDDMAPFITQSKINQMISDTQTLAASL